MSVGSSDAMSSNGAEPVLQLRIRGGKLKPRVVCTVCGDKATGYNFGAIVCESCKSFFRRHAHRKSKFSCPAFSKCRLNKYNRRHCAACRLKSCRRAGMRLPPPSEEKRSCVTEVLWTTEKMCQRRLLVSRLMERIATQGVGSSSEPEPDTETETGSKNLIVTYNVRNGFTYDDLLTRFSAAANLMQLRSAASPSTGGLLKDASSVRLAFRNYISALRQFPELVRLGKSAHKLILSEKLLAQINLYALFSVNAELDGWCALDADGSPQEHRFDEFVQCLAVDGVDARAYVLAFRCLTSSLRERFGRDWPVVLVALCLVNLCSLSCVRPVVFELSELRGIYEWFLKCFLDQRYAADCADLYHFCIQEFPIALAKLVEMHRNVLAAVVCQSVCDRKAAVCSKIAQLFEPVVSELADYYSLD